MMMMMMMIDDDDDDDDDDVLPTIRRIALYQASMWRLSPELRDLDSFWNPASSPDDLQNVWVIDTSVS